MSGAAPNAGADRVVSMVGRKGGAILLFMAAARCHVDCAGGCEATAGMRTGGNGIAPGEFGVFAELWANACGSTHRT